MGINLTKTNTKKSHRTKLLVGLLVSTSILGGGQYPSMLGSRSSALKAHVFADTTNQQLIPGQSLDTGNHTYGTADIETGDSWTTAGTATSPVAGQNFSTTLVSNTKSSAGLALFKGALDMTKPANFQGTFSITVKGALGYTANALDGGDSLGFILTPDSTDQISSNLPNSTNENLGVGGLPSSVFLGRDLYDNTDVDQSIANSGSGTSGATAGQNVVCIRTTDTTGTLSKTYQATTAPDPGVMKSSNNTITETMAFSWQPNTDSNGNTVINGDGTVTGTLTYVLTPQTGTNAGKAVTVTSTVTLSASLSLGVVGATGNNYGTMTFANDGSSFTAYKGTNPVTVNYINKKTNETIASSSTIMANVGDSIDVTAPDAVNTNTSLYSYTYNAPTIAGFDYSSPDPAITVANNDSTTNSINVYYTPTAVNTVKNVTVNQDDQGNILTDTAGYVQLSSSTSSDTVVTDDNGDSTTTNTTTIIWHKPVDTVINQDDQGNDLVDTTGYVKLSTTTSTPAANGDITTTNIWHLPINQTVNVVNNVDESGQPIADTSTGYTLVQAGTPVITTQTATDGDTTTTSTVTNIWHQVAENTVSTTVNLDEQGNTITDLTGYVSSAQTKPSVTTTSTADNGDVTTTITSYLIWHKVVTTTVNQVDNVDEQGNPLSDTTGYHLMSSQTSAPTTTMAANGDITITNTTTNVYHKIMATTINVTANIDESGATITDTTGYIKSSQTKPSMTSTVVADNGDETSTITSYTIWKKSSTTEATTSSSTSDSTSDVPSPPAQAQAVAILATKNASQEPLVSIPAIKHIEQNPVIKNKSPQAPEKKVKVDTVPKSTTKVSSSTSTSAKQAAASKTKPTMTATQKMIQVAKVESAGAGGAIAGMAISAGLFTLAQRFIPAGFIFFLLGKRRKKKKNEEE
ncbi:hypothetical protein [Lactococcus allomyrinae]|uniref:Uncharacterized protein n=1 Tax=Lactococcus allomyrinae TaxID=2419773 RepID=A0A387BEU0_9LACT|nr:hypothetical protein [Lactococcus allomyrinae]AYG01088.1 hypothetical protein D7I46_08290 [Lactococcus allomyrinae]